MAAGFEHVIGLGLPGLQVEPVHLGVLRPIRMGLIKAARIGAVLRRVPSVHGRYVHHLFDFLLLAGLVDNGLLDFLGLDVVADLLLDLLAETLHDPATVFLEGLIQGRIGRSKGDVALLQNAVARDDAGNGSGAQNDGGGVELGILYAGLEIGGSKILLGVLDGVGISGPGDALLLDLVDLVDGFLDLLGDLAGLDGSFAGHDRADDDASNAGSDQELRALLLNLETDLVKGQAHRLHDFVLFHGVDKLLSNSVLSGLIQLAHILAILGFSREQHPLAIDPAFVAG